jgi:hypothetical protein
LFYNNIDTASASHQYITCFHDDIAKTVMYTDRIFISFVFLFNFNIWYLINILKYNTSLFIDIEIKEPKQGRQNLLMSPIAGGVVSELWLLA